MPKAVPIVEFPGAASLRLKLRRLRLRSLTFLGSTKHLLRILKQSLEGCHLYKSCGLFRYNASSAMAFVVLVAEGVAMLMSKGRFSSRQALLRIRQPFL